MLNINLIILVVLTLNKVYVCIFLYRLIWNFLEICKPKKTNKYGPEYLCHMIAFLSPGLIEEVAKLVF